MVAIRCPNARIWHIGEMMNDYYRLQIPNDIYNEIIGLLKQQAEESDSYLEIKDYIEKISYLEYEKNKYVDAKRKQDYAVEIEQSTIDGFIRFLIQIKHRDPKTVVDAIHEYYDYISSINDNYLEKEKQKDITARLERIAYDNQEIK